MICSKGKNKEFKSSSISCLVKETRNLHMHAYCFKTEGENVIMGIKDLSK